MHQFLVFLFALTGGLTLSGITANIYRMVGRKPEGGLQTAIYYAVMIFAGPSVLFENATRSFRAKDCSRAAYGFAITIAGYWALALGLLILSVKIIL